MADDVLEGLVPDPLPEIRVPPQPKSKKASDGVTLDGLVEEGQLKEIVVPAEKEPQSGPESSVLDGLLDDGKLVEESMENEALRDKMSGKRGQLEAREKIENPKISSEGETAEEDWEDEKDEAVPTKEESLESIRGPLQVENRQVQALEPLRVLEAALFLANKPLSYKQMQDILQVPAPRIKQLLGQLSLQISAESAVELSVTEHAACLQLKPRYLERVAHLSKEVELSRKSMRILALVAKKKQMLQSELKNFFKGEIYAYVTELREAGYVDSKKHGNTRLLKPSGKFFDSFQFKE